MVKIKFWKEEKNERFFGRVKDTIEADGNIVLIPYFDFYHKRKRIRSHEKFCVQVKDIKNEEFKMTLGMFVDDLISKGNTIDWNSHFQQCVTAIRWMDPVLSEFKKTSYASGIEIMIQFRRVKEIGGSVDESKVVRLNFEHLRSKKTTLHYFIHELIHMVQFAEGYNMYNDSTEDEQLMLEDAETYLFNTNIPKLWRSLI